MANEHTRFYPNCLLEGYRDELAANLVNIIVKGEDLNGEYYYPGHLTTGVLGTKHLFPALSRGKFPIIIYFCYLWWFAYYYS